MDTVFVKNDRIEFDNGEDMNIEHRIELVELSKAVNRRIEERAAKRRWIRLAIVVSLFVFLTVIIAQHFK